MMSFAPSPSPRDKPICSPRDKTHTSHTHREKLTSSPRSVMRGQNVNVPAGGQGRDCSPQPHSPVFRPNSAQVHSSSTAASSVPSGFSTTTSILVSRASPSPAPIQAASHAAAAHSSNSNSRSMPSASSMGVAPKSASLALYEIGEELASVLISLGYPSDISSLMDVLSEQGGGNDSPHLERFVDELSGSNARRLAASMLKSINAALVSTHTRPPPLVSLGSGGPHRNTSLGSMIISQQDSPRDPIRSTLMRPSFANETAADPYANSTNSNIMPAASPFNLSGRSTIHSVSTMPPQSADGRASLAFKNKQRRESEESYSSLPLVGGFRVKSVRNTTSLERSVNLDGHKMINDYTILRHLGKGTSGKVKQVMHHETGECRAIKIVRRSMVKKLQGPHGLDRLRKEVAIMKKLHHKNIVKLYEVIDDPESDKMYFVMQYVAKGEVLPGIDEIQCYSPASSELQPQQHAPRCQPLPEARVVKYVRQAASGLIYLHNHGVVHFDVKPQNILCDQEDNVVLADFGVSELMLSEDSNMVASSGLGTPSFMAPEVCRGDRMVDGEAADTWSLGVTVYAMLYGVLPFGGASLREQFAAIQQADVQYPPQATAVQKEFLSRIFVQDPTQRWSLRQLRQHPFLSSTLLSDDAIANMSFSDSAQASMEEDTGLYASIPRRTGFVHHVMAITQEDMDGALSRLVSPVYMNEMGDVISSRSHSSMGSDGRSSSPLNESPYSASQSPHMQQPVPPPNACGDFSVSDGMFPIANPRGSITFNRQLHQPSAVFCRETITPPIHRHPSLESIGLTSSTVVPDDARTRRETQVMHILASSPDR